MKNMTIIPIPMATWQLTLSALDCATSAPTAPNAAFAPFSAAVDAVATDIKAVPAVKRERALTGTGHRGFNAVYVSGFHAWSPPV
ncbi:hypothetical protein [Nocardioides sp. GCM10030258]|jgi:hypothetical protein|uniref:hypothetical protein n=2 Tax=Nocardioides TaxID=1839 RepID=UPI00361917B0